MAGNPTVMESDLVELELESAFVELPPHAARSAVANSTALPTAVPRLIIEDSLMGYTF